MTIPSAPPPPPPTARPWRKPRPRLEQLSRTWYFFRRNTLGLIGFGILVAIAGGALYAATLPIPWTSVPIWCAADYGPTNSASGYPGPFVRDCPTSGPMICTYENSPPPNAASFCGGLWYPAVVKSGISFASIIAPTATLAPFSLGPMPLGGLTTSSASRTPIYNVADLLLRGADWSLLFSVSIVGLGAVIGLLVGSVAGFYGGRLDEVLMRLVDIFLSIPTILFVIVLVAVAETAVHSVTLPGFDLFGWHVHRAVLISPEWMPLFTLVLGFAAVWWPFYARIVRGQVLTVREQKYVEAAQAAGSPKRRTLFRHIIPNSVFPVFIQFSLDVGTIPLLIGALVFLGFATVLFPTPVFPELGAISALSVQDLQGDFIQSCLTASTGCVIPWWQLVFPGIALFAFAISVNLVSDGLRDALDPRMRR